MRTHTINAPVGRDADTDFALRQQNRTQNELQIFDSPTVKVESTTRGIRLHAKPSGGGNDARNRPYRIKSIQGDYLTCRTWDGTTEGETDVLVAKTYKLRNSIVTATIDGVVVTYTYPTTSNRIATKAGVSESQFVVPRYLVDDVIWVERAFTLVKKPLEPGGPPDPDPEAEDIGLKDCNDDGRAWSAP